MSSSPSNPQPLPMCQYGYKCYRKNPQHFLEFRHPRDFKSKHSETDDAENENDGAKNQPQTSRDLHAAKKPKLSDDARKDRLSNTSTGEPFNFFLTKLVGVENKPKDLFLSISIKEILSPKFGRLIESAQFNFKIDIDWLVEQYDASFRKLPVLIVFGDKRDGGASEMLQRQADRYDHVKLCRVVLFDAFGTHHTKMMLLRYENGLRVVIHTANLVHSDWALKTQGVWVSPLFPLLANDRPTGDLSKTKFKRDLLEYLNSYRSKELDYWCNQIKRHDLSSANVFLIASSPGRHIGEDRNKFGHLKLRKVLSEFGPSSKIVDSNWIVVGQFSSVGSLGAQGDSWLCSEWLSSLSKTRDTVLGAPKPTLKLIFPSVEDVRKSLEGYAAGGALPYSAKTAKKQTYLKSLLHLWRSELRGRTEASPHIKSYLRMSSSHDQMSWFLLTSANLSKAAWGCLEKNNSQLAIKSFELGVLFLPSIFGNQEIFNISSNSCIDGDGQTQAYFFPIPFDIPLTKYTSADEPWTWDEPHAQLPDRHGDVWIPG